jgi:hypothetical protein
VLDPPGDGHGTNGQTEHNHKEKFAIATEKQHRRRPDNADAFRPTDKLPVDNQSLQDHGQRQGGNREKHALEAQGQIAQSQPHET